MKKGTIFSGMRPTGKLHIGHLSVLKTGWNFKINIIVFLVLLIGTL